VNLCLRQLFKSLLNIVTDTNVHEYSMVIVIILILVIKQFLQVYKQNMETTSILWIQKISFAQFYPAHVGFGGFAQPGFNHG